MTTLWLALGLFAGFLAVAAIDAMYYHGRQFRLWAHRESRLEHGLHTVRAVLMPPTIAVVFLPSPDTLWIAIALIGLDAVTASADIAVEWRSRKHLGGLPHGEYATHVAATALHVTALTLAFIARPSAAGQHSGTMTTIVIALVVVTSITAIQHVVLLISGARDRSPGKPGVPDPN